MGEKKAKEKENISKIETMSQIKYQVKEKENSTMKSISNVKINSGVKSNIGANSKNEIKSELLIKATRPYSGWVMIQGNGNLCIKANSARRQVTQSSCNWNIRLMWRFIRLGSKYIVQNRTGYVLDNYAWKKIME